MSEYSYPKSNRLLKPSDFKSVFNPLATNGKVFKIHSSHLMVFVCNTQHPQTRLGMAITKKKLPTAVARNRVKRIIKEQFRHHLAQLPVVDMVFIVKKPTHHLSNAQIHAEVEDMLKKIVVRFNRH